MAKEKFETNLKQLEKIIEELEHGDLDLDSSLKKFEEGVRLSRFCSKKLDDAERKIELLVKSADGEIQSVPFSPDTGENQSGQ